MLQGRWWKQALGGLTSGQYGCEGGGHKGGSVSHHELRVALLASTHRSVLSCNPWDPEYGHAPTVSHELIQMCWVCITRGESQFYSKKTRKKIGGSTVSLLSRLHYQCVVTGNQACTSYLSLQAKTGSAALVSPLAPWHEKSTLSGSDKYRPWTNYGGIQT